MENTLLKSQIHGASEGHVARLSLLREVLSHDGHDASRGRKRTLKTLID
jgi:hypothetical protein